MVPVVISGGSWWLGMARSRDESGGESGEGDEALGVKREGMKK